MEDQKQAICLNLGCGSTFHPDWRNLDISPNSDGIEIWDAKNGIPAKNKSVDFIYHSHMLEHLNEEDGKNLIRECFRVLKPHGVLRVAVLPFIFYRRTACCCVNVRPHVVCGVGCGGVAV